MADAVMASVLALQGLLTNTNPNVVVKAAGMILDLDKTQMRHGRPVCGTDHPTPLELEPLPELAPPTGFGIPTSQRQDRETEDDEPCEEVVEQFRVELQAAQDRGGGLKILTPDKAGQLARFYRSRGHNPLPTGHPRGDNHHTLPPSLSHAPLRPTDAANLSDARPPRVPANRRVVGAGAVAGEPAAGR
jgi:hypothetical protein